MRIKHFLVLLAAVALTACEVALSAPTQPNATPIFVTATLPATRTPFASPTTTATVTGTPGLSITASANCKNAAVLLQDVTIADGTNI
ncbi:MAG: hypothetical protein V1755_08645, partial [Chloroflexota bacterium]